MRMIYMRWMERLPTLFFHGDVSYNPIWETFIDRKSNRFTEMGIDSNNLNHVRRVKQWIAMIT